MPDVVGVVTGRRPRVERVALHGVAGTACGEAGHARRDAAPGDVAVRVQALPAPRRRPVTEV